MSRSWILLTVILLVAGAAPAVAQDQSGLTVVTGTLLGAGGEPLPVAHARIVDALTRNRLAVGMPDSTGRFALATVASGILVVQFSAPDHQTASLIFLAGQPAQVAMDVRLAHNTYRDTLGVVKALGDFNAFDFGTAREMARQPDGTYTLEVKPTADTLSYQVLGVAPGQHSINGTESDRFSYDGGGDYRSVLDVGDDTSSVTITFDPAELVRVESTEEIAFRDTASRAARAVRYMDEMRERDQRIGEERQAAREAGDSTWTYDYSEDLAKTATLLESERDPLLRQLLLIDGMKMSSRGARVDEELGLMALEEVPPSSPWWSLPVAGQLFVMIAAIQAAEDPEGDAKELSKNPASVNRFLVYIDSVVAQHPSTDTRANALNLAIAMSNGSGQKERANQYFARLTTDYPDHPMTEFARARFASDRVFRVGATVPEFRFTGLDDSSAVFTRESMKGSVYMMDFWAVWCGPCITEMPFLQQAYEKYNERGFEILSISLDNSPEDVRKFRGDKWAMPWRHTFVTGGFENPLMKRFEIIFLPRAALVDESGTIIAVDGELRGGRLEKTLAGISSLQTPVP